MSWKQFAITSAGFGSERIGADARISRGHCREPDTQTFGARLDTAAFLLWAATFEGCTVRWWIDLNMVRPVRPGATRRILSTNYPLVCSALLTPDEVAHFR